MRRGLFGVAWPELLLVWGVIALVVAALHAPSLITAYAQSGHEGEHIGGTPEHARYHDYYKEWKQPVEPNSEGYVPSCCSANTYADFGNGRQHMGGDCEPTTAELRKDGHWWAKLPQHHINNGHGDERGFVKIPHEKVIRETNPEPDAAHLCWVTWGSQVLCFVPPFGGM